MCLAQGHNTVTPVRLEPAATWSRVKHPTTEPLRSLHDVETYSTVQKFVYRNRYIHNKDVCPCIAYCLTEFKTVFVGLILW